MKASAVVSRSPSPVKASATAFPGPAKSATSALMSERTGPCRVARMTSLTSAPPFTSDRLHPNIERLRSVRRHVLRWIAGIDGFYEQVLDIGIRGRQSPGDRIVLAKHEDRCAGQCGALDGSFGRDHPGQIPEDRGAEFEMRVVGEDRLAGQRPRSGDHPLVGRAFANSGQGAEFFVDILAAGVRVAFGRQGCDGIARPCVRKQPAFLFRSKFAREASAQKLDLVAPGQLIGLDLPDDQRVGRLPRFGAIAWREGTQAGAGGSRGRR